MTTYAELYNKVLFKMTFAQPEEGKALFEAKEAVNDAQKIIARIQDFDELITTDESQLTVASQKTYVIGTDWTLTRCKDIFSIRYMDDANSRKLNWVPPSKLDEVLPYTEQLGDRAPFYYTRRGRSVELIPTPAEAKSLYIHHSQWPTVLTEDDDETDYEDIDDVIIKLAVSIAQNSLVGVSGTDWSSVAANLLSTAVREEMSNPDEILIAQPFRSGGGGYVPDYCVLNDGVASTGGMNPFKDR